MGNSALRARGVSRRTVSFTCRFWVGNILVTIADRAAAESLNRGVCGQEKAPRLRLNRKDAACPSASPRPRACGFLSLITWAKFRQARFGLESRGRFCRLARCTWLDAESNR